VGVRLTLRELLGQQAPLERNRLLSVDILQTMYVYLQPLWRRWPAKLSHWVE